jgi:peptidoglycan/LPS O-acetylase OafA/YrhL
MRSEFDRNGRVSFSDFWLRRALRILPQFYLVLAAAYGSAVLLGQFHLLQWHILLAQALHVTNYWIIAEGYEGFPNFTGTVVYWSLAVEEHFYVIFPFLYVWMRRRNMAGRQQAVLLLSLCGVIVAWRCWLVLGLHVATDRTYMASDTRIDSILFGCVLAVYRNPVRDRVPGSESLWRILVVPLAVLALLLTLFVRAEWFRETLRYSLQGMALIPLFAAAIRFPGWLVFRWLNWRPVAFLGVLSYSLYLVHFGAIFIVRDALHGAALRRPAQTPGGLGVEVPDQEISSSPSSRIIPGTLGGCHASSSSSSRLRQAPACRLSRTACWICWARRVAESGLRRLSSCPLRRQFATSAISPRKPLPRKGCKTETWSSTA